MARAMTSCRVESVKAAMTFADRMVSTGSRMVILRVSGSGVRVVGVMASSYGWTGCAVKLDSFPLKGKMAGLVFRRPSRYTVGNGNASNRPDARGAGPGCARRARRVGHRGRSVAESQGRQRLHLAPRAGAPDGHQASRPIPAVARLSHRRPVPAPSE